jgi:hypothetical protein
MQISRAFHGAMLRPSGSRFDAQLGYAHRDKAGGGPIAGLALRFEF